MLVSGSGKRSWTKTTNVWILQLFVSMDQIISMCFICIINCHTSHDCDLFPLWSKPVMINDDNSVFSRPLLVVTPVLASHLPICIGIWELLFLCVRSNSIYFLQQHLLFPTASTFSNRIVAMSTKSGFSRTALFRSILFLPIWSVVDNSEALFLY